MTVDTTTRYSSVEVCRTTGVTYRQLDYWCRLGILRPDGEGNGSGTTRRFHPDDVALIRGTQILRKFGLNTDAVRNAVARLRAAITSGLPDERPDGALAFDADGYAPDPGAARLLLPLSILRTEDQ